MGVNTQAKTKKTYIKASSAGYLYFGSSTPQEGYEEIEMNDGRKTYHKKIRSIDGLLTGLDLRTAKFESGDVRLLNVDVTDTKGEIVNVSIPVDSSKGLTRIVKAFINSAYNLDIQRAFDLSLYLKKTDNGKGKVYENLTFAFSYQEAAEGEDQYSKFIDFKTVPDPIKKKVRGKDEWDFEDQDTFYFELLEKLIARFKDEFKGAPVAQPSIEEDGTGAFDDEPVSDLPF